MNKLMKPFTLLLCIAILSGCKKDEQIQSHSEIKTNSIPAPVFNAVSKKITASFGGYYSSVPGDYESSSKKYPVLIFLHGLGQRGNGRSDLPKLGEYGIGKLIKEKQFPAGFTVKGKTFSFIVIAPQYMGEPTVSEVNSLINYIKKTYRIDASRIYISGLSAGGILISEVVAANPKLFAAFVPIAGVSKADLDNKTKSISAANLPVWMFHNSDDDMVDVSVSRNFFESLNSHQSTIKPKLTIFNVTGHDAWTAALNPSYKENNLNIYEWMLQYSR